MQLTQFTDYSLRTLIYLGLKGDSLCNISDIASHYAISRSHLVKVISRLGQLDYIHTIRGNNGGIRLKKPASEINLAEVVQKVEPNFYIVECFDVTKNTCIISPQCILKKALHKATQAFLDVLSEYTLTDVITNKRELNDLLFINDATKTSEID